MILMPHMLQPHFEASVRMKFTLPKVGTWRPPGLQKTQSLIAGAKTPHIEVFFILLERTWSVNVQNGLAWAIQTSTAQVMVERRAGSQTGNLTPDHYKWGIDPISVCVDGMQHTFEKLLRRATSFLQTSSQSEVWIESYELPKSQESKLGQFQDSSLGVPGQKAIRM
jgi:hypothetical protein